MSATDYGDWIDQVERKLARRGLGFLQLGSAHEPARRALRIAGFAIVDAEKLLPVEDHRVIVIDRVEALITQRGDVSLGVLRERVFSWLDDGTACLLLSRAPRVAYPAVPGSSLLDDASFVDGPELKGGRHTSWPTCADDGEDSEVVLRRVLVELGPEVCAAIDRVIFESLLTDAAAIDIFTAREVEAIRGAGLITLKLGDPAWNFTKPLNEFKEALGDVLAADVLPQAQLGIVSHGMWQLERMLRRSIRLKATAAWGSNWRQQCVATMEPEAVLKRATEAAYPAANSIKLIRDPLEWLTLGQLLDLKQRREIGDLGLSQALWRNFAADIMPIRNRLAHMRTLHPGDAADVAKWLKVLEVKLAAADKETREEHSDGCWKWG